MPIFTSSYVILLPRCNQSVTMYVFEKISQFLCRVSSNDPLIRCRLLALPIVSPLFILCFIKEGFLKWERRLSYYKHMAFYSPWMADSIHGIERGFWVFPNCFLWYLNGASLKPLMLCSRILDWQIFKGIFLVKVMLGYLKIVFV